MGHLRRLCGTLGVLKWGWVGIGLATPGWQGLNFVLHFGGLPALSYLSQKIQTHRSLPR